MNAVFRSLRAKLFIVIALVSVVPLAAVAVIIYNISSAALTTEIYKELESVSDSRANHIAHNIEYDIITMSALARGNKLLEEFSKPDPSPQALEEIVVNDASRYPIFGEIFILDMTGRIIATSDRAHLGLDRSDDEYFKGAMSGKPYFKSVYKSPVTHRIGYAVAVPIKLPGSEKMVGIIVGRSEMSRMNRIMSDDTGLGRTGEVYIIDESGLMITASRLSGDSVILNQKADNEGIRSAMAGNDVTGVFTDYRGSRVLGHYSLDSDVTKATGKRWCIIAEVDLDEAMAPVYRMMLIVTVLILVSSLFVIAVSSVISKRISDPVMKLSDAAGRVSSGDLTVAVEAKGEDEIGQLARSFNSMVGNLSMLVSSINKSVGQITSASSEILAATQQQAAGAREQSAAVSETTAASKELSKSAEQVGDSIKRVLEVATHALAGMAKIKGAIGKTGQIITSLNEKSQKIGKITEVIDDVADQTNLLAVNAAIEAARAGEQGRGFTVVADEIRKLADSTAKSTKDITALIEVIQHEMSNAIMSMETSVVSVDEEAKLSQESAERSEEIAMSATQQISGSRQIAEAMSNVDEAMKQIAVSAQQSQVALKQLSELSKDLRGATEKFKVAKS